MDNRQQLGAMESGDAHTGQDRGNYGKQSPTIVEPSPQSVTGRSDEVEATGVMQNEIGVRTLYSIEDSTDAGEQPTVEYDLRSPQSLFFIYMADGYGLVFLPFMDLALLLITLGDKRLTSVAVKRVM